ncbi:ras-GEF domain-containing family member 1B-like [Anopheles bellator]|uniref:ras-GEF domain-containing family member 1B-like n=1 Tax=Anopheles bellator TaxID=139047 RepID=UPI002648D85C|nr:ras-GEF domain-containing family member 1B-like [Anopheles bellator]
MSSTTAPTAVSSSSSLNSKKPPIPHKPSTIPPPANSMLASASLSAPKSTIRTSLLAQRLEETLRLGIELEVAHVSRHAKINCQTADIGKASTSDSNAKCTKKPAEDQQLQAALQAEMRRQCGSIKAKFLVERRFPQNGDIVKERSYLDPSFTKPDDLLLHYTEGNLMSGSLEGLLTHFTPSPTYFPDRPFIFTFLLAARQFIRPDEILDKVMKSTLANGGTNNLPYLLSTWMNDFPYDFRDERMIRMVRDFTEQSTESERNCYKERNTLSRALRRLANRLTKLEKYELEKTQLQKLKFSVDEWRTAQPLVEIAGGSPMQMANTLTAIEVERFSFIGLEEFFPPPYVSSYRGGVSNLLAYVQWYNRLTYVVATDILRSPRKRHRARAVEFWIETGRECFNRGNFNSLMAIIATLTGGPIGRLKKTWTKVTSSSSSLLSGMTSSSMISSAGGMGGNSSACSSAAGGGRQQLAILEHQADPTNNFATYRATLQAAAWRSSNTKKESTIAVLPFFSLLLKDLHFLNETSGSTTAM